MCREFTVLTNIDLERIIELSSREVTGEEGIEHFNLKNKLESQLEDADSWKCLLDVAGDQENLKLIQINKQLKEDSKMVRNNYKLLNTDFDKCIKERDNLKQILSKLETKD